jgi:hypothetical protein
LSEATVRSAALPAGESTAAHGAGLLSDGAGAADREPGRAP